VTVAVSLDRDDIIAGRSFFGGLGAGDAALRDGKRDLSRRECSLIE